MDQSQALNPPVKSLSRKPEPYVLVLDPALINPEDANLITLIQNIAQTNTKIVLIGNEVPLALKGKLPSVQFEAIILQNLTANKNQYAKDKTFCFMLNSTSIKTMAQLGKTGAGFYCEQLQQEKLVDQLKSFYEKNLVKPVSKTGSSIIAEKKSALSQSNLGLFKDSTPVVRPKPTVPVQVSNVVPEQKIELPPVVISSPSATQVKGIVIEDATFSDEAYYKKLWTVITQASEKKIPVIIYCSTDERKNAMLSWLESNGLAWIKSETPQELPSCLIHLELNSDNCLYLSAGKGELYVTTHHTTSYVLITPETDFTVFLNPDYKLPKTSVVSPSIIHSEVPVITASELSVPKHTVSSDSISSSIKGIIIDENFWNLQVSAEVINFWKLIAIAKAQNTPVILYCNSETSELEKIKQLKGEDLSWIRTTSPGEFKDCLSRLPLSLNDCLCLSNQNKSKGINCIAITEESDFDGFFKTDFQLPKPHIEVSTVIAVSKVRNVAEHLKLKLCQEIGVVSHVEYQKMKDVEIKLNTANGCLSINLNTNAKLDSNSPFFKFFTLNTEQNLVGEFHNIDELKNIFELCGFYPKPRDIHVKLMKSDNFLGKEKLFELLEEKKTEVPTVLQFLYEDGEDSEIYFYLYDLPAGSTTPQLIQLGDVNNSQLIALELWNGQIVKATHSEKSNIIHGEIALKNCEALYLELCGGEFQLGNVWKKVKPCPEAYHLSKILYYQLTAGMEGIGKKNRMLPQIEMRAKGVVCITLPKALAEVALGNAVNLGCQEFFNHTFVTVGENGNLCATFSNADDLMNMLLFYNISFAEENATTLYKALSKKYGFDFKEIWKNCKPCPANLSNILYDKLTAGVEGIGKKKRTLPQIEMRANGLVCITLPKALAEIALGNAEKLGCQEFFNNTFKAVGQNGNLCATFSNVVELKKMLSFYDIDLSEKSASQLYQALCENHNLDFEEIWDACKEPSFFSTLFSK